MYVCLIGHNITFGSFGFLNRFSEVLRFLLTPSLHKRFVSGKMEKNNNNNNNTHTHTHTQNKNKINNNNNNTNKKKIKHKIP